MTTAVPLHISSSQNASEAISRLTLQCPQCAGTLEHIRQLSGDGEPLLRCSACLFLLQSEEGIWKGLPQRRQAHFHRFMAEYQAVRAAEGRGSEHSEYYLALPYRDLSGHNASQWAIRARTFQCLERNILPPLEAIHPAGMDVLDLGAGNGWLSYRLALRGHRPVAVDLLTNEQDGLGAAVHFRQQVPALFPRFQAELEHLPFADNQFDLAIFNASFHYSENYELTLRETTRCLRSRGTVIIADTAWYRNEDSGQKMLEERRQAFTARYGFPSDGIESLEYLTDDRLKLLEERFGLRWRIHKPLYGIAWAMRPWLARFRGGREPSQFRIYVAEVKK